jgi:hypothetical protein
MDVPFRSLLRQICNENAAGAIAIVHNFTKSNIEAAERLHGGHSFCQHALRQIIHFGRRAPMRGVDGHNGVRLVWSLFLWYYA